MTAPPAPPTFASLDEFGSRLGDVGFRWPYVAEILERRDPADAGHRLLSGVGGTYPAFLHGDVVMKLFGYSRSWRERHAAERAAPALVATDRFLHTVASFVSRSGFTAVQEGAHAR